MWKGEEWKSAQERRPSFEVNFREVVSNWILPIRSLPVIKLTWCDIDKLSINIQSYIPTRTQERIESRSHSHTHTHPADWLTERTPAAGSQSKEKPHWAQSGSLNAQHQTHTIANRPELNELHVQGQRRDGWRAMDLTFTHFPKFSINSHFVPQTKSKSITQKCTVRSVQIITKQHKTHYKRVQREESELCSKT